MAVTVWARMLFVGADGRSVDAGLVSGDAVPDLETVDEIARAHLAARRLGARIQLVDVRDELAAVLDLAGLCGEVRRQAEGGEEVRVEEGVEPRDPAL